MGRAKVFCLVICSAVCALALLTRGAGAWVATGPGSRASAVVVDAAGDVIAAGYSPPSLSKMSGATGEVIWRCEVAISETPSDIALDAHGDVFVVGSSRGVTKVSGADGSIIWQRGVGGTSNAFQNFLNAVVVDRNGDALISGSVGGLFNVSKLDGGTGDIEWYYEREGYAKAVAVDPAGDVAAAGLSNKNFAVVKLRGSDGLELWERELNGAGNWTDVFEEANAVVMDTDGSVIAVGDTANIFANVSDFTVVKYAPDGSLSWSHAIDGGWCVLNHLQETVCQSNDSANAVALGRDGSVYAAGFVETDLDKNTPGATSHMYVARFTREGVFLWGEAAEAPPLLHGEYTRGFVLSLAVDAAGNAYAASQHDFRFAAVKFDSAGQRLWLRQAGELPGAGNHCTAVEVVADASNNVVVAGETLMPNQLPIYTVLKLRGADGSDYTGRDTVPPTLTMPSDIFVDAATEDGASVYFDVIANDNNTAEPSVTCDPPSGATFGVGVTTVKCVAHDADGNSTRGSFNVTVQGAPEQLTELPTALQQLNLPKGAEHRLTSDLKRAQESLTQGQTGEACRELEQFAKKVRQESGKSLKPRQAARLLALAKRIGAVAGCN